MTSPHQQSKLNLLLFKILSIHDDSVQAPLSLDPLELSRISKMRDYVLKRHPDLVHYNHSLGRILGQEYPIEFKAPNQPMVNPISDEVEKETLKFAGSNSLYVGKEAFLQKCGFGWLVGCVHPLMDKVSSEAISFYYTLLFNHDDFVDTGSQMEVKEQLEHIHEQLINVWKDQAPDPAFPQLQTAHRLFTEYFKPNMNSEHKFSFEEESLRKYLQSVYQETEVKHVNEEEHLQNRQHTGGIRHAISVQCLREGLDTFQMLYDTLTFDHLLRDVSDIVGILNDILSLKKELKQIQEAIKKDGKNPNDITEIKKRIQSNIVLIKFRDGLSLREALDKSLKLYHEKLDTFYNKKEFYLSKNPDPSNDAIKFLYILEGWLFGHPLWAILSGRYNPESHLTHEEIHQKISRTKILERTDQVDV